MSIASEHDTPLKQRKAPLYTLRRIVTVIPLRRTLAILGCLVFAGVAEGLGVASLLPLLSAIGPEGGAPKGVSGQIVQVIEGMGLEPTLGFFLSLLVGGMLIKAALTLLAMYRVGQATADVANKMRLDLIDALLAARWGYYVRQPVGRFSAALSAESSQAGEAYNAAARFSAEAIQVATYVVVATLISWRLGLLSLGIGLLMVLTLNRFITIAKRTARKQKRHIRALVAGLVDLLVGIKPMKAMGRHARFQALFERDANRIRRAQVKQSFAREANKALQEPFLAIFLAGTIYVAVGLWGMSPGHVLVMALVLARVVTSIGKAQQALQAVRIAQAAFSAIANMIDGARAMRESDSGGRPPSLERGIAFRDVSCAIDGAPILSDVSFEIGRGSVTTLTGPSGAGKTTTVDVLLGLHEASSGVVLIDGQPLPEIDLAAWRRMIGYVPQELILFHDTLRANLTLGNPDYSDEDVARALAGAGAAGFVASLPEGLDTVLGERGARLSGGQRQRIAIARALIHRPKLLILDEATTALDPETEANIVRNVIELARSTGLTVLAISHQPAWERASDMVVRLERGRLVAIDRPGSGWSTATDDEAARAAADGVA
ncbi:ABC transporter ATP-binding protein [Hansschlegelia beijingensis]|uniref:ABC transporter ATP-binding protein n=1 Tax=Hansschlegelia beijingensis TaxID=1133344 RepID=UPI00387F234F